MDSDFVSLHVSSRQEFLARTHTWHEEVVDVEIRNAKSQASIQPGLGPRNLSYSP